jgi:hypothetical protein
MSLKLQAELSGVRCQRLPVTREITEIDIAVNAVTKVNILTSWRRRYMNNLKRLQHH